MTIHAICTLRSLVKKNCLLCTWKGYLICLQQHFEISSLACFFYLLASAHLLSAILSSQAIATISLLFHLATSLALRTSYYYPFLSTRASTSYHQYEMRRKKKFLLSESLLLFFFFGSFLNHPLSSFYFIMRFQ